MRTLSIVAAPYVSKLSAKASMKAAFSRSRAPFWRPRPRAGLLSLLKRVLGLGFGFATFSDSFLLFWKTPRGYRARDDTAAPRWTATENVARPPCPVISDRAVGVGYLLAPVYDATCPRSEPWRRRGTFVGNLTEARQRWRL
jgi:hypothetical protein